MIPGLPKWDETDRVSKAYQGSQIKPPPETWWKHFSLSLGPSEYGIMGGDLAARWWAVYIQPLNNFQAIWIIPARLDGLGWDRPRLFHTFSYARITETVSLGFNKNGHAIVSIKHGDGDYYGPPNSITTYSFGLDYGGMPAINNEYIMDVRSPVVATAKPTDVNSVTYLFFIDSTNVLSYVTDQGTGLFNFESVTTSNLLGPSWEILHGGYRIDGKFQLGYRHDADDPYPEQPPATPSDDEPDVIPMDLLDTPDTGHTLQSLGEYGLDYPNQVTRANDELEILFYPGGPTYRDNTHLELEGNEVWASSTLTAIGFGFGMWGLDPTTDNMLDHYNCYVELIDGGTIKRAKLVINVNPEDSEHKWFTYAKETTPGRFSTTDLIYPEYSDFYHEYISDNGGVKYVFGSRLPAVDEYYYGTNPGALWLVSIFYPNAAEWPIPISGRTLTFRMKAIPKKAGKTPVQLTMDVHFDIPKP